MNYQQQIKHPLWQKKRLEVLELHNFQCQECEAKEEELHVHHPFYRRGAMIWDYDAQDLMALCHVCHKDAHAIDERIRKGLAALDKDGKWFISGVLDAKGMNAKLRETANYDANRCMLKIENHEHSFGAASYFGLPPQDLLWNIDSENCISLAKIEWMRYERRTQQGLPTIKPPKPEGEDGPL